MRITVIGSGYVGLVTGVCLSCIGHSVLCVDIDQAKIDSLKEGRVPIYEPGLAELLSENRDRIRFSASYDEAVEFSRIYFIAVGTPPGMDGSADLSYVVEVARQLGRRIDGWVLIVNKSTVPVGTAELIRGVVESELRFRGLEIGFDVASNPEFLKEGSAVVDFLQPERIIIGTDSLAVEERMSEVYRHFEGKLMFMDIPSAELSKYATNAMLALRISFMNHMAILCERVGADIEMVERGIGSDSRIGHLFLRAGVGYGGSCLPKDIRALARTFEKYGLDSSLIGEIERVNERQKLFMLNKISDFYCGNIRGKTFCLLGLAFKPDTDDMREAPSLVAIRYFLEGGAKVRAFDPQAGDQLSLYISDSEGVVLCDSVWEALDDVDALLLVTEWGEFAKIDLSELALRLRDKVIFDGRRVFNPGEVKRFGMKYFGVGIRL